MIACIFPGLGKTPLAKKVAGFVDLDYDFFKDPAHPERFSNLDLYGRVATRLAQSGFTVLINEPKAIEFCDVSLVLVPKDVSHSAAKLQIPAKICRNWVNDWIGTAVCKHIPCYRVGPIDINLNSLSLLASAE